MTTIRDKSAPEILGERRHSIADNDGKRIGMLLVGLAVLMTLMNLAAAMYLYRASAKVALVQKQLDEISSFETRLGLKLDLVNTGIQGQFDKLNNILPSRFNEINTGLSTLQRGMAPMGADGALAADAEVLPMASSDPVPDNPDESVDPIVDAKASPALQKPSLPRKKVAPAPSSSYQRTETADGLVHYKKVK